MPQYPLDGIGLQAVSNLTGISIWTLRYHFDSVENLFSAAASRVIDDVAGEAAAFRAPPNATVYNSIASYAEFVGRLVTSQNYTTLLFLVLRSGLRHRWVRARYEQRVLGVLRTGLENVILEASLQRGSAVALREGAALRFIRAIEAQLALPALLCPGEQDDADEASSVLAVAVKAAFAATYLLDWTAAPAA